MTWQLIRRDPAWRCVPLVTLSLAAGFTLWHFFAAAAEAAAQLVREKEEAAAREFALEAERKAARDARYAARKKRK